MSEPVRVLIADDNPVDRQLLSAIVRRAGYGVVEAGDGIEALERFRSQRPQLVLLDALMPRLDGFEVARQMKLEAGEELVPIIFLTSLSEPEALARALEAGGDDFLSKPYNRIVLEAKLNALQRMRDMHATMQRQRDEIRRHHAHLQQEQEAAKAVFDSVARNGQLDAPFVRYLISPLSFFNGDVLLAARNPADDLFLLVGDFTGHGLAAAVGAMPLAEIFHGMTEKGFGPGEIVREGNRKLLAILPKGFFCCTTLAVLRFRKQELEFWNGGLPPGRIVRRDGSVVALESHHLPLGILDDQRFDPGTAVVSMVPGDRLILFTDGIIDARNRNGDVFGHDRIDDVVRAVGPDGGPFEALHGAVVDHIGEHARDDDITLVEVTMVPPDVAVSAEPAPPGQPGGPEDWRLTYELGPRSLRRGSPLPFLQQILAAFPALRRHGGTIYTVLSELYTNALEHGVLALDSSQKNSADGFAEYYRARSRALQALDGFIRFCCRCEIDADGIQLRITVTDTGAGFDYRALEGDRSPTGVRAYHGRGLALVRRLCREVTHRGGGNEVEVLLAWDAEDD
jgi:two-component system, HptB-dependent secretion and biofilm response regulator